MSPENGFSFIVPGLPCPWSRAGGGKSVARFTPSRQRNYMQAIRLLAQAAMRGAKPLQWAVSLKVIATYHWPRRWKNPPSWKTSRPDIDNLQKIVMDALNGVAWVDDAQVCYVTAWKEYGDVPGLRVTVEGLI